MTAAPSSLACDMVARGCEPAQKKGTGHAQCLRSDGKPGPGLSPARCSPGIENDVELQGVYGMARNIFEAQLQILVDDVPASYADHQTVVIAEVVSEAAEQFPLGSDHVSRHAGPPQPLGLRFDGTDDGKRPLEFARIHVAGFGVDVEVSRYCREIVAPENLEARSVVEVRNAVLAKTAAKEQSPVIEPLGRGDGREPCRNECNRYEARYF